MGKLILNFFAFYHYDMASSSALLPPKRPQMTAKLDALKLNYVMGLNRDALLADWTMHGVIQGDSHIKGAGKGLFAVQGNPLSKTNSFLKKRFAVSNIGAYYVQSDLPEDHLIPFHGIIWIDEESPENPSHPNNPLRGHADLTSRCLLLGHQPIVYPQGKKGVSNSLKLINH
jgi:hypothetical protein